MDFSKLERKTDGVAFDEARKTARVVGQISEIQNNIDALNKRIDKLTKLIEKLVEEEA